MGFRVWCLRVFGAQVLVQVGCLLAFRLRVWAGFRVEGGRFWVLGFGV